MQDRAIQSKGVDQLTLQTENAKRLLSNIDKKFPHYRSRTKLAKSIKKLEYAIKVTLKKIQTIQGHIQLYTEVSKLTETPKKRKLLEDTLLEKNLQFAAPNFNDLESHSVGTPASTNTPLKTPETRSSGQVSETEDRYAFLFTKTERAPQKTSAEKSS